MGDTNPRIMALAKTNSDKDIITKVVFWILNSRLRLALRLVGVIQISFIYALQYRKNSTVEL